MSIIRHVKARQIFDSRGHPTLEVDISTPKGTFRAAVPSSLSAGLYDAWELRDNVMKDYGGRGVSKAIAKVNKVIGPALIKAKIDPTKQEAIDEFLVRLNGPHSRRRLGVNSIVGVSMAACRAGAAEKKVKLYRHIADLAGFHDLLMPVPAFNVINGGKHAGNELAMQEFMLLPVGATTFSEAMKIGSECYHHLKNSILRRYGPLSATVGDEGGFAPQISSTIEALDLLAECIKVSGYEGLITIGIGVKATEFFRHGKYDLDYKTLISNPNDWLTADSLMTYYREILGSYPVTHLEDPFDVDDWDAFSKLTKNYNHLQIVGDELIGSEVSRIQTAIDLSACNSIGLKLNQIGTVSEVIRAAKMAKGEGMGVTVSCRCGDTEDTFIADLTVGLQAGHLKAGAPCRSERVCKYNQLLRIEEQLGRAAVYVGKHAKHPLKAWWESKVR